jgi:putative nucleotidyltransferase with HDIG domain
VGDALDRFEEDSLRALRAGRFLAQCGCTATPAMLKAARKISPQIHSLSAERIRDEIIRLLETHRPSIGFNWLERAGILKRILPEVVRGKKTFQGGWHSYDVFRHTLVAVDAARPSVDLRLALLLHDIAKPITRTRDSRGYHFYRHDRIGAEMSRKILRRLRFSRQTEEKVFALVLHHLFEVEVLEQNPAALRRFLQRVGNENVDELFELRRADVKGCGPGRRPSPALKRVEDRIRKLRNQRPAISLHDLKANGRDVMAWLRIPPGPEVGEALKLLLDAIVEDPSLNCRSILKDYLKKSRLNVAVEEG